MSLLKADTIKPVTSSGDLSLQGDSGGSAVDCLNITSAGDINFTGNTDAKIKLPSAGGIYESDGSTAVLTESGGVVSLGSGVAISGLAIKQVQQTVLTAVDSVNSTTYEVMLSRSITPLDVNSHFLIMFSGQISTAVGSAGVAITGTANATDVTIISPIGDALSTRSRSTWGGHFSSGDTNPYLGRQSAITYLHDPALSDLSTIYYNVSMADLNTAATQLIYINRAFTADNNAYVVSTASTLTVMEIAQSS
tara:strand:- start:490 stop:1242 length:753 start_codon:yes stop_codon:yes gene_type:complete